MSSFEMKYLTILVVFLIGLVAADNVGQYIPKAFFTIDENGNPSPAYPINSDTLKRVRRQVQPFQPFGFGQPLFFPQIQPGAGSQGTFVSSSVDSRFGGDEPVVNQQSHVFHHRDGNYHQTNVYTNPDGSTSTSKQSGRVKRQQSQLQSQNGESGNQVQGQSQNPQGAQQIQTQSQGQNHNQVATPAVIQPVVPLDNRDQQNVIPQGNQQYAPQYEHGQPDNYPQQVDNRQPQSYPQGQPSYPQQGGSYPQGGNYPQGVNYQQAGGYPQGGFGHPGFAGPFGVTPFGIGGFGPFGGVMPGIGFGNPFGFQQPFMGAGGAGFQPGPGTQTTFTDGGLQSRFSDDEPGTTRTNGGTSTFTSHNGHGAGAFHSTSSFQGPDGRVTTRHHSSDGRGGLQSRFSDDEQGTIGGSAGGTSTFSTHNGVFHSTSSVLGPDGKVIARHHSGRTGY